MNIVNKNLLMGRIVSAGYSQRRLAPEIGMSKNTLNSKINGRSAFNVDEIDRLCEVIGISAGVEKADIFLTCSSQKWDEHGGKNNGN